MRCRDCGGTLDGYEMEIVPYPRHRDFGDCLHITVRRMKKLTLGARRAKRRARKRRKR
jgi:hypothetical protein